MHFQQLKVNNIFDLLVLLKVHYLLHVAIYCVQKLIEYNILLQQKFCENIFLLVCSEC